MVKNGTKIIKLFLRFFFLTLLMQYLSPDVQAQTRAVKQAERKHEQQLKREKKEYEKRRQAALKHRYDIQSSEVKARMKETAKRSEKYGRKQKEPFFKKLFSKKKKRKKTRKKKPR